MYNGRNPASAMCNKAGKTYFPASRIQLSCPEPGPALMWASSGLDGSQLYGDDDW